MSNVKYIRKGKTITTLSFDQDGNRDKENESRKSYSSINEAKRESRNLQLSEDGALGRGSVQVVNVNQEQWYKIFEVGRVIVSEKIHGANISVWYSKVEGVKIASRKRFLETEEDRKAFYGCDRYFNSEAMTGFSEFGNELFEFFDKQSENNVESVILYGEYYGGDFPDKKSDSPKVQKGVYYNPNNNVRFFDIGVKYENIDSIRYVNFIPSYDERYIPYMTIGDDVNFYTIQDSENTYVDFTFSYPCYRLDWVPFLIKGMDADEVNSYKNIVDNLDSLVPEMDGHGYIKDNKIEGLVFRPMKNVFDRFGNRLVIKMKSKNFSEKKNSKPKKVMNLTPEVQTYVDSVCHYVNENRLESVLSKEGTFDSKLFGKYQGLLVKDALEDWSKENDTELEKDQINQGNRMINKHAANVIREYMMK